MQSSAKDYKSRLEAKREREKVQREENQAFIRNFKRWLGLVTAIVVFAVIAVRLYQLGFAPRYRFGFAAVALLPLVLLLNRSRLQRVQRPRGSFAERYFLFPGYLLTFAALFLAAGVGLHSIELLTASAIAITGWAIAPYCDKPTWIAVSPAWLILFLICVPIDLPWPRIESLESLASQQLDLWGIFHHRDLGSLHLVDADRSISLGLNRFFSEYGFIVFTALGLAVFRVPVIQLLLLLAISLVLSQCLIVVQMVIAGWISHDGNYLPLLSDQLALQFLSFLALAIAMIGMRLLLLFFLAPTPPSEHRTIRLFAFWNRIAATQLGDVMWNGSLSKSESQGGYQRPRLRNILATLGEYFRSRSWLSGLVGLPIAAVIALAAWHMSSSRLDVSDVVSAYQGHFRACLSNQQLNSAEHTLIRLQAISPPRVTEAIELANAIDQDGHPEQAAGLVEMAVAADKNNVDGRIWLARHVLSEGQANQSKIMLGSLPESKIDNSLELLETLGDSHSHTAESASLAASLLYSQHKVTQARNILQSVDLNDVETALAIARLQKMLGFNDDAVESAHRAIAFVNYEATGSEAISNALIASEAFSIAQEHHKAEALLQKSLGRSGPNAELHGALVTILLRFSRQVDWSKPHPRDLERLRQIDQLDPSNLELQRIVATLLFTIDRTKESELEEFIKEKMRRLIESKQCAANTYVVLGSGLARDKRFVEAKKYLGLAYSMGNRSSDLLNNLAWSMIHEDKVDYAKALQFANQAVASNAKFLEARKTRADIFIALDQHLDAISDLELVFQFTPESKEVREKLSLCYEAIGESELASEFREKKDASR